MKSIIILTSLSALALGCPHSLADDTPTSLADAAPTSLAKKSSASPKTTVLSWNEKTGTFMKEERGSAPPSEVVAIWEGALPSNYSISRVRETSPADIDVFPKAHKSKAIFSREARPAYLDEKSGALIVEYLAPALKAQDGAAHFYLEKFILSKDGLAMTTKRHRMTAPSPKQNIHCLEYRRESLIPFVFKSGNEVILFKKSGSKIISCDMFVIKKDAKIPVFEKRIYPTAEINVGIHRSI